MFTSKQKSTKNLKFEHDLVNILETENMTKFNIQMFIKTSV